MIVWCDLETTGLDPRTGSILEIAMVATDDQLVQVGEPFVSLVRPLHLRGIEAMDDFVKEMHEKNGLLDRLYNDLYNNEWVLRDDLPRLGDVERAAIQWLAGINVQNGALNNTPADKFIFDIKLAFRGIPLGGNTVHFDKRWLIEHMDELEALFSHRIYDVSSFTEEAKRFVPSVYAGRPGLDATGKPIPQHRALDDIMNSIATARYYRAAWFSRGVEYGDVEVSHEEIRHAIDNVEAIKE